VQPIFKKVGISPKKGRHESPENAALFWEKVGKNAEKLFK